MKSTDEHIKPLFDSDNGKRPSEETGQTQSEVAEEKGEVLEEAKKEFSQNEQKVPPPDEEGADWQKVQDRFDDLFGPDTKDTESDFKPKDNQSDGSDEIESNETGDLDEGKNSQSDSSEAKGDGEPGGSDETEDEVGGPGESKSGQPDSSDTMKDGESDGSDVRDSDETDGSAKNEGSQSEDFGKTEGGKSTDSDESATSVSETNDSETENGTDEETERETEKEIDNKKTAKEAESASDVTIPSEDEKKETEESDEKAENSSEDYVIPSSQDLEARKSTKEGDSGRGRVPRRPRTQEDLEGEYDDSDFEDDYDDYYDDTYVEGRGGRLKAILYVILGLCAVALLYFGFQKIQDSRYSSKLAQGQQQIDTGDYQGAIGTYESAISLSSDKPDAYQGLSYASIYAGDAQKANQAYKQLADVSGDEYYRELAVLSLYGNSNGNVTNGGNVCQQAQTTYLINNFQNTSTIYRRTSAGEYQALLNLDMNPAAPVKDLNVWGSSLFFVKDNDIWRFDFPSSVVTRYNKSNVNEIMVYNGSIYYSCFIDGSGGLIYRCALDGSGDELYFKNPSRVFSFIIEGESIYAVITDNAYKTTELRRITMADKGTQKVYDNGEGVITGMATQSSLIFFKLTSQTNPALNNSVYAFNTVDSSLKEIFKQGSEVDSINFCNGNLYYVAGNLLFRSTATGSQQTRIGDVPAVYPNQANSINTTVQDIYVFSSQITQPYENAGINDTIKAAPFANLNSFAPVQVGPAPPPTTPPVVTEEEETYDDYYDSDYYDEDY